MSSVRKIGVVDSSGMGMSKEKAEVYVNGFSLGEITSDEFEILDLEGEQISVPQEPLDDPSTFTQPFKIAECCFIPIDKFDKAKQQPWRRRNKNTKV